MDMDLTSGSMKLEKLNENNYHAWKQKIMYLLAFKDLEGHILEDPPEQSTTSTGWYSLDKKAMALIGLSLSDEILENVRDCESAREMWKAIMNVFERHTLLNQLSARRSFYTAEMKYDEKVLQFANRIRQMASTLKSMDVDINDKEMAMTFLNGLPESYDGLISALDALGNEDKIFTFDLVKSRVLQEEQRMKMRNSNSIAKSETAALLSCSVCKKNMRCSFCNKNGHDESKCFEKYPHLREQYDKRQKEKSLNAAESYESSVDICLLSLSLAPGNDTENGLLDTQGFSLKSYPKQF